MVDAPDLKSVDRKVVPVQVRPGAPIQAILLFFFGIVMSDTQATQPNDTAPCSGFYRTELRVMQIAAENNEVFLTQAATLLTRLNQQLEQEKHRADMAEHQLRVLKNEN